jgi:hypothetical protein
MQGGYWRVDRTFRPQLVLTNLLENVSLPVTPILYMADGTRHELPSVLLPAASSASVDISQALKAAPPEIQAHASQYGSVGLKYGWHWANAVTALVENRDVRRSLNFNFEVLSSMKMNHAASTIVREGMWWKEDPSVRGFLAIANTSDHLITAEVQVLSDRGEIEKRQVVVVPSRNTQKLDLLDDSSGKSGGIRVTYDGTSSDVALAGGLESPRLGYSAKIPLRELKANEENSTVSLSSVGLMVGDPDPMMHFPVKTHFDIYLAMRNTTDREISVSPTLYFMAGSEAGKASLNSITLSPRAAFYWNSKDFREHAGFPNFSGIANIIFSYQGTPADVLITNGSIDQTKSYVFEILMQAIGKSHEKSLGPWKVANGDDTMINLLNTDDKEQDVHLTLFFDGGKYTLPIHLKPGGSSMFNVSEFIMMQEPDPDGNKIPQDVTHGSAVLWGARSYPDLINVGVSVGIFNATKATCGSTCPTCFGYTNFQVQSVTSTVPVGGTAQFKGMAFGQNNVWQDVSSLAGTVWSSSNSGIASSQGRGNFLGVAGGAFTATATASLIEYPADCAGTGSPCPFIIWVRSQSGKVQVPTSLKVLSATVLPDGPDPPSGCPGSLNYGIKIDIKYQVLDQNTPGVPIQSANMTPHETGTFFTGGTYDKNIGPTPGYPTSSQNTASDGTFHDVPVGICSAVPFTSKTATQNITIIMSGTSYPVRSQTWTAAAPGSASFGHGTIQNAITSPGTGSDVSKTR